MLLLDQNEIDRFTEQYEAIRLEEAGGPELIARFLKSVGLTTATCSRLISELIQVDIEIAWMAWEKQLPGLATTLDVAAVQGHFDQICRFENYSSLIDGATLGPLWCEVAQSELIARDTCGDSIGPPYYALQHGLQLSSYRYHEPIMARCEMDGSSHRPHQSEFMLRGRTLFGRQRSSDSKDSFVEQLAHGNRIVIANRMEAQISREQLSVQLLTPSHAIVTNLCHTNPVVLAPNSMIEPSASRFAEFPFVVRLPGRRLYFYRSSHGD